ncbi:MAG: 2-succinyl-5-enolpyruvyl-6-hydroxy-3-cyclohexene-1-carboxylic-acid synthase [Saprospiraceae bacterium]|nr:2-succinyl-5-enolpyruvyl-6-hydroxy-3-cyclohexene-1-carboxylic-acid synthase [Saprospiraceae bacterium]
MELSNKAGVQTIVKSLAELGLRDVIICPGSRNAPFVISFNRHPDFRCISIRDERSAGFFALGMALELQRPVALLCTSGSATANFAPAITEAYYQRISLIILSTDRPVEWTDQGDGQTIRQSKIYDNFIRKSYDLKGDSVAPNDLWYNARCLSEGFAIATEIDPGPVHFNIPLSEPLYETTTDSTDQPRVFRMAKTEKKLSSENISNLISRIRDSSRIMILAGQQTSDTELTGYLRKLSKKKNFVILTETTSYLKDGDFIANIDRCITGLDEQKLQALMPDILITIGGAIVSKRIKACLRKYSPEEHWNIHLYDACMDTYQSLTAAIPLPAEVFFRQMASEWPQLNADYKDKWQSLNTYKREKHTHFEQECEYSDFNVFAKIFSSVPKDYKVHIANSSAIRYAQLFDHPGISGMHCNRGTSGIEGCTSTAMGAAAAASDKKFLLITGDVAFHYDINALWNESNVNNLKIILINNSGGGIFRIIEGPNKVKERREYIETSMKTDAKQLASHFKWNYLKATDEKTLKYALEILFSNQPSKTILEIFTNADKNPLVLENYWNYLTENKRQ